MKQNTGIVVIISSQVVWWFLLFGLWFFFGKLRMLVLHFLCPMFPGDKTIAVVLDQNNEHPGKVLHYGKIHVWNRGFLNS
jgi:hypothetical protein